jgi:hypothetical protein
MVGKRGTWAPSAPALSTNTAMHRLMKLDRI